MRENECVRQNGGRETHKEERKSEGEERDRDRERPRKKSDRERDSEERTDSERERERVREGERVRKNNNMLGTYYATKCTRLHGMKHHTQSQSTFSFYLIKPYQPFSQTRTSTTHNQTTFSPSLRIYSHISHSSQSYGQQ